MLVSLHSGGTTNHSDTNRQTLTCEVIRRPRAQFTGSAGVLVEHILVIFTRRARPAAAHLAFTDNLAGRKRRVEECVPHNTRSYFHGLRAYNKFMVKVCLQ